MCIHAYYTLPLVYSTLNTYHVHVHVHMHVNVRNHRDFSIFQAKCAYTQDAMRYTGYRVKIEKNHILISLTIHLSFLRD